MLKFLSILLVLGLHTKTYAISCSDFLRHSDQSLSLFVDGVRFFDKIDFSKVQLEKLRQELDDTLGEFSQIYFDPITGEILGGLDPTFIVSNRNNRTRHFKLNAPIGSELHNLISILRGIDKSIRRSTNHEIKHNPFSAPIMSWNSRMFVSEIYPLLSERPLLFQIPNREQWEPKMHNGEILTHWQNLRGHAVQSMVVHLSIGSRGVEVLTSDQKVINAPDGVPVVHSMFPKHLRPSQMTHSNLPPTAFKWSEGQEQAINILMQYWVSAPELPN